MNGTRQIKESGFLVITDDKRIVKVITKIHNRKTTGMAKCNLGEDKFDFETGLRLALGRATGKVYKRFDKVVENSRKAVVSNISLSQEKLMRRLKKRKLL